MKMFGNRFDRFCWNLQRELKGNHKPLVLFLGNGFESQILLLALHRLRKRFVIVHIADTKVGKKVRQVLSKFRNMYTIILRPERSKDGYKVFENREAWTPEDLRWGFSPKDYLVVTGFKLSEHYLLKAFYKDVFGGVYSPLLRYCDEDVQALYQDMKDNEPLGQFLFDNLTSDSHHNITIS